ncbi:HFR116Wp [Eremothecium sinecaudum]|uniref:HFR116Wp n=1 Tax=Eremothecium sinecaudum TaxID=45286 RepID=A0A0X8HUE2_9SACH|nr:HFR116Wp [Eremothecium sinecaudum]AMD21971.1 HFR116Wp [Eremothecium sinecaudum]
MSYRRQNYNGMPDKPAFAAQPYTSPVPSTYNKRSGQSEMFQKFEQFSKKIEDLTDHPIVQKIVPYTPTIARFFIVATFYEDSIRIASQWPEQVFFLSHFRHFPYMFVVLFLMVVAIFMMIGATMILLRKQTVYATGILCICILSQGFVYGLFSGSTFVLRNFSVIGGLLITFGDSIVKNRITFGMLPELTSKDGRTKGYLLLAGRILIILMFVTFTFGKNWLTIIVTIAGTICIAIGYKTKFASIVLCLILAFYNITLNNYWFYGSAKRDFLKYEFYQNLNIIGGLLLVINTGAGDISFDEKKKIY